MLLEPLPHELHEPPTKGVTKRPEFFVTRQIVGFDLLPKLRLHQLVGPIVSKAFVPEFVCPGIGPARSVYAVGDCPDGHVVNGTGGIQMLPHFPAYMSMPVADTVGRTRHLQCK